MQGLGVPRARALDRRIAGDRQSILPQPLRAAMPRVREVIAVADCAPHLSPRRGRLRIVFVLFPLSFHHVFCFSCLPVCPSAREPVRTVLDTASGPGVAISRQCGPATAFRAALALVVRARTQPSSVRRLLLAGGGRVRVAALYALGEARQGRVARAQDLAPQCL